MGKPSIMVAEAKHRETIVGAAAALFRRQGYAATGLAEILAASGAPKGSLYHYFPGGKGALGVAAITAGGARVAEILAALAKAADGPGDMVRRYGHALGRELEGSGWTAGCPIATILLEVAPQDEAITRAGREALESWRAVFSQSAIQAGIASSHADSLAELTVAAFEGALLQSRVARSTAPLAAAAGLIAGLFDQAVTARK